MWKKIAMTAFKIGVGIMLGLLLSYYWVDIKHQIVKIFH